MSGEDPVVEEILAFAASLDTDPWPREAAVAVKAFIADSLGVAVCGAKAPWRREVLDMACAAGGAAEASVIAGADPRANSLGRPPRLTRGSARRHVARGLPLAAAAMVNAFQIHALEFDCVHEKAVVHPMATILPVLLGAAEREGGVSGRRFLRASIAAIEVAVRLGLSSRAPMRFFRPANAGGFGATLGLGLLSELPPERLRDALGIYLGALSGTMQAHLEGTPQLAMQMGFAARSAVTAVDLARRGMPGPHAAICGEFGYFALFEGAADPAPFADLGRLWRSPELSHKPFPCGRATHGGIDGLMRLMREKPFAPEEVGAVTFRVPPLVRRLVGRPALPGMAAAHARLSLPYVGAVALARGGVGLEDFSESARAGPDILALARRLEVVEDGNRDPNALLPQEVEIALSCGEKLFCRVEAILGSPERPLSKEAQKEKFAACWRAVPSLSQERGEALWEAALALEEEGEVSRLARLAAL